MRCCRTTEEQKEYIDKLIEHFYEILGAADLNLDKLSYITNTPIIYYKFSLNETLEMSWKKFIITVSVLFYFPAAKEKLVDLRILKPRLFLNFCILNPFVEVDGDFLKDYRLPSLPCDTDSIDVSQIDDEKRKEYCLKMQKSLKELREIAGLPQTKLSEMIYIRFPTYNKIENLRRELSWDNFLLLLFVFLQYEKTKRCLIKNEIFTPELYLLLTGKFTVPKKIPAKK